MASLNSFKYGPFLGLLCSIILILHHGLFHCLLIPIERVQNLAPSGDSTVAVDGYVSKNHCLGSLYLLEERILKRSKVTGNL